MARGPCARAQRGRSGRRPGRAGAGILVLGGPMTGRPGAAPVPGGADADGAGLTSAGGAGPAGTGPGTGAAPAGTGPGTGAEVVTTTRARAMAARLAGGWPLRRTFLVGFVIVTLFSLAAIVVGGTALANLASARDRVVNK